jgi:hypothetical protein
MENRDYFSLKEGFFKIFSGKSQVNQGLAKRIQNILLTE